ncbi:MULTISPECIES: outer membrane protein assembly factor BamB [Marinomonas]|uniref:Outer membrane protein assembly factor BamB n=1 Tax=Marinomonas arctica TaxID=383750 RepID=A0A7H1J9E1_9GAMM|nr:MULTISPECIES: outer membrane protein assembly factor BamB [Marinomonas]MCS7485243.1 lipoprotein [Marinomonas sp. BSi20414]QNT07107.1 outer membrane protein assembly factor BamB [Marinomonas arctica]GGN23943.1 outer membrane protein assembly factor BamB [Marinomonas arctica]
MNKSLFLVVLFSALVIQGCSNSRPALPDLPALDAKVNLKTSWRTGVDGNFGESSERFNLVAEDDALFFVTEKGTVYELGQEKGKKRNAVSTEFKPSSGVTRHGDTLFFGTYDAKLIAVSLTSKSVLWEKTLSSEVLSEAAYAAGKLAIQTADGWLSVLDAESGDILWRAKEDLPSLTVRGTSAPIIADGKVIAGFASGRLKAFSLQSGNLLWSYEVGKPEGRYEIERLSDIDGRLVVSNGVVYAVAYNGTLVALSLDSGRPLWQRSIASSVGVAVKGELLVAVDMTSKVIALNAKNGTEVWENADLVERDLISPEFFRDYVAVMDRAGYVHLLDLNTGEIAVHKVADNKVPPGSRMVANDKQLFILTPNSNVTALSY